MLILQYNRFGEIYESIVICNRFLIKKKKKTFILAEKHL